MGNGDMRSLNPFPRWRTISIVMIVSFLLPIVLFSTVMPLIKNNSVAVYFETIIAGLILGGLALWAIHNDRIPMAKLGMNLSKYREAIIMLIIGWTIVAAILIPLILIGGKNVWDFLCDPLEIIETWLFVGVVEELLFRGYLLTRLLRSFERLPKIWGTSAAIACSSAFFTITHIPSMIYQQSQGSLTNDLGTLFSSLGMLFLLSLIMSYFFLRTRNILFCGLLHGNGDAPLISGSITTGGITVGGDGGAVLLGIVSVVVIEVTLFIKKRR